MSYVPYATTCRKRGAARVPTVDVGGVLVGSAHPIVVQSMTNTDTADVAGTVAAGRGAGHGPAASWCG